MGELEESDAEENEIGWIRYEIDISYGYDQKILGGARLYHTRFAG